MVDLTNVKLAALKTAAKEMNEFLELDKEDQIVTTGKLATAAYIGQKLQEAHELLEDGEFEELSETTQDVFIALGLVDGDEDEEPEQDEEIEEEEEEEDEDEDEEEDEDEDEDLTSLIEACTKMAQLKGLIEEEDVFKPLRKKLAKYPSVKALKGAMLKLTAVDTPEPEKEEEPASKKTGKKGEQVSVTNFADALLAKGGDFRDMLVKLNEHAKGQGKKPVTLAYFPSLIKYRKQRNVDYLKGYTINDDGCYAPKKK